MENSLDEVHYLSLMINLIINLTNHFNNDHYIWCVNPPNGVEDIEETELVTGKIEEEAFRNP